MEIIASFIVGVATTLAVIMFLVRKGVNRDSEKILSLNEKYHVETTTLMRERNRLDERKNVHLASIADSLESFNNKLGTVVVESKRAKK